MFGKDMAGPRRVGAPPFLWFQSPCAGNMFGKVLADVKARAKYGENGVVSIPVCGEHVW